MVQQSIEDDTGDSSRRASGRARKLTAKAQALSGTGFLPADSPNIPATDRYSHSASLSVSPDPGDMTATFRTDSQVSSAEKAGPTANVTSPSESVLSTPSGDALIRLNKGETPIEEELTKRSSKRERKPTARALEADEPEEPASPVRKRSVSPATNETLSKMSRKAFGQAPKIPSRLRHSINAHDDDPEVATVVPAGELGNPAKLIQLKFTELSQFDRPKHHNQYTKAKEREAQARTAAETGAPSNSPIVPQSPKADLPKHHNQYTIAKERGALARASAEASDQSSNLVVVEPPKLDRPKHHNQHTKRKEREAAARAAAQGLSPPAQPTAVTLPTSDRPRHPNQHTKRREREAATRTAATQVNRASPSGEAPSNIKSGEKARMRSPVNVSPSVDITPKAQKRLILTMPLPSTSAEKSPTFPAQIRKAEFLDKGCQLFCLDAASRILAFAEIAAESSDDEDGDGGKESGIGLYEKWLDIGRQRFCVCGKPNQVPVPSTLTEDELTQILEPNDTAQSPGTDRASDTSNASSAMSFPPVNSIVNASEGRRVSAFYEVIAASAPPSPVTNRRQETLVPPIHPPSARPTQRTKSAPHAHVAAKTSKPLTFVGRGSHKDRTREHFHLTHPVFLALEPVRQEALAHGIDVTIEMSLDQLRALIEQKKIEQRKSLTPALYHHHGHTINGDSSSTLQQAASSSTPRPKSVPLKLTTTATTATKPGSTISKYIDETESQSPDLLNESTPRKRKSNAQARDLIGHKRARVSTQSINGERGPSEVVAVD